MDAAFNNARHSGKIILRDLAFYGYHGVAPEELELGQRFTVDLVLWLDLSAAAASDQLEDTISYALVYEQVQSIVEGAPSKLLEHLAGRIARAILAEPRVARVTVRVTKQTPPIKGMATGSAAIELDFTKEDLH